MSEFGKSITKSWPPESSATAAPRRHAGAVPACSVTLTGLARRGLKMAVVSDAPRLPVWLRICGLGCSTILTRW